MASTRIVRTLGATIRELRVRAGMSQDELAVQARVSRVYLGMLERGQRNVSFEVLYRVANALGTTVSGIIQEFERKL